MTVITVSSASQLESAMKTAVGGDTIRLAGGNYGDFAISAKMFTSDITITSMDAGNPATFHSLSVKGSANINFQGVNVDFVPTATTASFSSAVLIERSTGVSFTDGTIKGGLATTGVPITATETDATGNVIGMPTGRGFTIQNSSDVTIEGANISSLFRGIVLGDSEKVTIRDTEIHHLRKSAIVGNASDLVIEDNYLHSASPWRIGQAGGDHADFIALWTNPNQLEPTANVTIKDNILSQGDGARILGMWLQGGKPGYNNVVIEGNAVLGGDHQGIALWDTANARVTDNVLLQTTSYEKSPGILLLSGTKNVAVSDNVTWSASDYYKGSTGNTIVDNALVNKLGGAGFYDQTLINKVLALHDADAIQALVQGIYSSGAAAPEPPPVVAPPVVAPPVLIPPASGEADIPVGDAGKLLVGGSASEKLIGSAGNDTIDGRGGVDLLTGGDGNDTYFVPNSLASVVELAGGGIDTVVARGNYVLGVNVENLVVSDAAGNSWSGVGNDLNNIITGNAGANQLDGAAGNDTISGGLGNDIITGGVGNDQLTGGQGADSFRFARGSGDDVIADFGVGGRDMIDVSAYLKAGLKAAVQEVGEDTVISFASGDSITLIGVDSHHVAATSTGFVYV